MNVLQNRPSPGPSIFAKLLLLAAIQNFRQAILFVEARKKHCARTSKLSPTLQKNRYIFTCMELHECICVGVLGMLLHLERCQKIVAPALTATGWVGGGVCQHLNAHTAVVCMPPKDTTTTFPASTHPMECKSLSKKLTPIQEWGEIKSLLPGFKAK